jgi:radical SAM superfamily enzyme YgiQ (UPF0313 family)
MKYKALLVYPKVPNTYWSYTHTLKLTGKKATMPPLGLMTIASLFPDYYDLKLVDMNIEELAYQDIEWADIVFVSAMIVQKASFAEIIEDCNRLNKPVVAGGPYPTTSHNEIKGVDYFVLNEGEITLPPFLEDFENGNPKPMYSDTTKPDITKTPPPRFDLIDVNSYGSLCLQNSRGCPFNCEFCDIIEMFGRKPRYKLPSQFVHEMQLIYDTGYRGALFIVDDNFIGDKRKVKELLKEIILFQKSRAYPYSFFTEASIDLAGDDELLDLMVAAGFDTVFCGIRNAGYRCVKTGTEVAKHTWRSFNKRCSHSEQGN